MASVTAIRNGLKARLDTISGGLPVFARWPNVFPALGGIIIDHVGSEPEFTFGNSTAHDLSRFDFEIIVAAGNAGGIENAEDTLDGYVSNTGAFSVRAALDGDRRLGGACNLIYFGPWGRRGNEEINGQDYTGQRLEVRAWST